MFPFESYLAKSSVKKQEKLRLQPLSATGPSHLLVRNSQTALGLLNSFASFGAYAVLVGVYFRRSNGELLSAPQT